MQDINALGIDISKNIFELCGLDKSGNKVYKQRVKRAKFVETVTKLGVKQVYMEACGGANHWSRQFCSLEIEVKLISPQYVKPFVKTNKNDANDAEAIAEAGSRGHMRYVRAKSVSEQDIQSVLRSRERLKKQRTSVINNLRGLLQEYGVTIAVGASNIYKILPMLCEDARLSAVMQSLVREGYEELEGLKAKLKRYEGLLVSLYECNELAKRLTSIPGIGMISALSLVSLVGSGEGFSSSRHLSAYLGLVPKQSSSGGREKLLGMSKRGNSFVRTMLIHGARSLLVYSGKKEDRRSAWMNRLKERRGMNRAAVAIANKNARIAWSLLTRGGCYDESYA